LAGSQRLGVKQITEFLQHDDIGGRGRLIGPGHPLENQQMFH
jgi:hypothetical protein